MHSFLTPRARRGLLRAALLLTCAFALSTDSAFAADLADPTRPMQYKAPAKSAEAATPGQMRVEAILNRNGDRLAIVDGKVVRAGDKLVGAKIEEVTHDGVRYVRNGATKFARLENARIPVRRMTVAKNEEAP